MQKWTTEKKNERKMLVPLQITMLSPLVLIAILLLLPSSSSVSFRVDRFDPTDETILYYGDAVPVVGAVELTYKINYLARTGWATYAHPIQLWDSKKLTDFSCRFTFFVDTKGKVQFGSGLAFFLVPVGFTIPPNSMGGGLALYNTTTSDLSSNQILHVEFDTLENPEWDPAGVGPHIGINSKSISSAVYTPWNVTFHGDDDAEVLITYTASTKNLSVSWKYLTATDPQESSTISYQVDLGQILPKFVTVGLSAATSDVNERHVIKRWEFNSSFNGNINPSDGRKGGRENHLLAIILPVIGFIVILIVVISVICYCKSSQRKKEPKLEENEPLNYHLHGPVPYRYIASATDNFSTETKLVPDGTIYRASMNMPVAVKRIVFNQPNNRGNIIRDKLKAVSEMRHRNLVQILGWGEEKGELLVMYEFVENGDLDSHLLCDDEKRTAVLDWYKRWKIAVGVACGLVRLHEGMTEMEEYSVVVHGGVKASNVMLDSSFEAKLGDFSFYGTEPATEGEASKSKDVFNFGLLLLEILTGQKSSEPNFLETVRKLYEKKIDSHMLPIDKQLKGNFVYEEAKRLMDVGLLCTHPNPDQRPTAREALRYLKSTSEQMSGVPMKMMSVTSDVLASSASVRSYASDETSELKLDVIHDGR